MIGYHYTGMSNWKSICEGGRMDTYTIKKPDIARYFSTDTVQGIWIWKHRLRGMSHFGTLFLQAGNKCERQIVMLELTYDDRKIVRYDGRGVAFKHVGAFNGFVYHEDEPAVVYRFPLPLERIKLERAYDLAEIIEKYDDMMDAEERLRGKELDRQPIVGYASIRKQKHNFV